MKTKKKVKRKKISVFNLKIFLPTVALLSVLYSSHEISFKTQEQWVTQLNENILKFQYLLSSSIAISVFGTLSNDATIISE